jgi:MFS transporter, DHA3 family, macrolide efflux protein
MSSRLLKPFRLFHRFPDLTRLWFGEVISQLGDSVFQIALIWIVLELTGSSSMTGFVAMSAYLPTLFFGLYAGVLADRYDHRRIMLLADFARGVLVLMIPILLVFDLLNPLILGIITFVIASFSALFHPARDSIIPKLVPESFLIPANSMIQSGWQLALLLGPGIAGFLIPLVGTRHLFSVDALSFFLSFVLILGIRKAVTPKDKLKDCIDCKKVIRDKRNSEAESAFSEIIAGLSYVWQDKRIRAILFITAIDNLFIMGPAIIGTPLFVRSVLGGDASDYALLITAYAVGTLIGTVLLNKFASHIRSSRLLLWGIVLDGITFLPLLWTKTFTGAYLVLVIHSLVIPLIVVPRPTLIQRLVPAEFRGRVFSMMAIAVTGLTAISAGLTGIVAEWIPINQIFAWIAVLATGCGAIGWMIPEFRRAP